jgi:hypothetical protein
VFEVELKLKYDDVLTRRNSALNSLARGIGAPRARRSSE